MELPEILHTYKALKTLFVNSDYHKLEPGKARAVSTGSTLKKIWPLRSALGITRLTDLTELDYIGIPVISATRPSVKSAQITATQGKGLKRIDAIVSAIMEAVERFSCAQFKETYLFPFDINNKIHMLSNICDKERWHNEVLEWVKSKSLFTNEDVFLPAADVLFPYYPSQKVERPMRPSTTGIASGNTFAEAILHSIFEVIERDTTSRFLLEGYKGSLVDLESITTNKEKELIKLFIESRININVFDLSKLSPIPVFYVSILNEEGLGPPLACAGQGAHILPHIALRRALTEAAQSRVVALQGSREDLIRHDSHWKGNYEYFRDKREYVRNQVLEHGGIKRIEEVNSNEDIYSSVYNLFLLTLEKIYNNGYKEVFYADLTHLKINIPVAFVSIPGMVDQIVEQTRIRSSIVIT